MGDRTTAPQSKTKPTWLLQNSIGKHLRSVYEIDRHIPEHIFRLLRRFEEQDSLRRLRSYPVGDPKVDRTSDDGPVESAHHYQSSDTEVEARR